MTNNPIPNVPRELKPCPFCGDIPSENSHALTDGGFKYGAIQCGCGALGPDVRTEYKDWPHWRDAAFAAWNERALLSAPSPAGVGGLGNTARLLLPALRQYMHNDGSGLLAGYDLETTQAIIDGLRGEVADLRSMLATVSKAGLRVRTERDHHARRISELETALEFACKSLAQVTSSDGSGHADIAVSVLRMAGTKEADALHVVEAYKAGAKWRIDAALSAVCAAAPNIAPTSEHSGS